VLQVHLLDIDSGPLTHRLHQHTAKGPVTTGLRCE
jgi:hypothetical protein